ncbi:hypothetical protein HR12_05815, partial [Microbacterium sp. SUBG005]
ASAREVAADIADVRGEPALRVAIAAHLGRTRGLDVAPDDVIVTAGTSDAMLLTLLALDPRGDRLRVGIENPATRACADCSRASVRRPCPSRCGSARVSTSTPSRRTTTSTP